MENIKIEKRGINILTGKILECKHMSPFLGQNDKTPGWDGEIYLYEKNKQYSNEFFKGKIQVQVKSTEKIKNNSYTLKRTYLDMFDKDGNGTLLFVVDVTNEKVYYKNLFPVEIKKILKQFKNGQKTKSIKIELAADKNINIIDKVCDFFWENSLLQRNTECINIENFQKYEEELNNTEKVKIINFNKEEYIYISDNIIGKYKYVFGDIGDIKKTFSSEQEVIIGDKTYLLQVRMSSTLDKLNEIIIEDTLILKENEVIFNLGNKNIKETIIIFEFILNFIKNKKLIIKDGCVFELNNFPEMDFKYISEIFNFLKALDDKLENYGAVFNNAIKEFSDRDWKIFNQLVNLEKNANINGNTIYSIRINNKLIFILAIKYNDGKIKSYNYFEKFKKIEELSTLKFLLKVNEKIYEYSTYITMNKEQLINALNMNVKTIEGSIIELYTPELYEKYTIFLLEVLNAYDETRETKWLELAEMIITLIISKQKENNNIDIINKYQILRRKRKLTDKEKNELKNIYDSDDNIMVKASCAILIDNSYDFKFNFEKLNKKEKEEFQKYPIYNLFNLE